MLSTALKYLPGLGEKRAKLLQQELHIETFEDLLYHFPYRYIDRTVFHSIQQISEELPYVQIKGHITGLRVVESGTKRLIAHFFDGKHNMDLIWFKGLAYIQKIIQLNHAYIIFGKPSFFQNTPTIIHPEIESIEKENDPKFKNIQGIYPVTEKLKQGYFTPRVFSQYIKTVLQQCEHQIQETLPQHIITTNNFLPLKDALHQIHFPNNMELQKKAIERLKFDELFFLELQIFKQHIHNNPTGKGIVFSRIGDFFNEFYHNLPFPLTNAQKNVLRQIRHNVGNGKQMNRLLQGDVGSGKTIVALMAALMAVDNGYQACIMAPTEILAQQHYQSVLKLMGTLPVQIDLLTGSVKASLRKKILPQLANGNTHLLIGTHALIEEPVQFKNLGMVIIDEQHRFGVEQRAKLRSKNTPPPHVLVMTATPIPRTLSMTLYGDLDVSIIDELPAGRTPIITKHYYEAQRLLLFGFLREQIKLGRQVYMVYPLVSESENFDYLDVQNGYLSMVQAFPPPEFTTVMVHGQMKAEEKEYAMRLFKEGKAHILVATTVIEVGVDVPNASVMVIENAEKFGLSQLHQLRGRVGRGSYQSYCILVSGYKLTSDSKKRLSILCRTNNGFEIAEEDLKMRGPGSMEGTQQSGMAVNLKIANLCQDGRLIELARHYAREITSQDPLLQKSEHKILIIPLMRYQQHTSQNFSKIG